MVVASPGKRYLSSLGLQLWTVRDQLERDPAGTLRAIRQAGYAQVELMRTADAPTLVPAARALGLEVTSAFVDWTLLAQPDAQSPARLAETVQTARELRLRYLVFGYIGKGLRETVAQMQGHAARANAFGRQCREAGLRLCYHHHSFEFAPLADGRTTGWEILLRELDPALVSLEADVFWLALGGLDPVETLQALRGRVSQVHLKDLRAGTPRNWDEGAVPADAFQELGRGSLDLRRILAVCAETGVDQCHVEQDQSPDPLASIAASLNFFRQS